MSLNEALKFAHTHRSRFVDQLGDLVKIPSVSTDPDCRTDVSVAAGWVAGYLERIGVKNVELYPPETHPIVYGELLDAGPEAPTVLIYGHYDVQPAEPLDKWVSDPFSPTVRGENLYGRGASDMKGNVMASLYAVEAALSAGPLPVNVKFMIEGQEEIGSPQLADFMRTHKDMLAADFCLNPDTGMLAPDIPTITYSLRGLAYFELRIYGPENDLHSGVFGGAVHNPAQVLSELIAGMHNAKGRVTLPGFYDDVRPLSKEERRELARLPFTDEQIVKNAGVPRLWGERDFTPIERLGARPTLEVNGLLSGFTGKGAKTVLPAYAMAKISCRLVPDQDSAAIERMFKAYLEANAPDTVRWELDAMTHSPASLSDRESPWIRAMMTAQEAAWGVRPLFKREGGSVPMVSDVKKILGIESVNVGCGLPDDNFHGPNEKLHLPTFHTFVDALIHLLYELKK
ncbi:MAG TPA: dipeptidase [Anaerolineales bacterium]|nr:dipeptidase [Anaerolineales bacterium]